MPITIASLINIALYSIIPGMDKEVVARPVDSMFLKIQRAT